MVEYRIYHYNISHCRRRQCKQRYGVYKNDGIVKIIKWFDDYNDAVKFINKRKKWYNILRLFK